MKDEIGNSVKISIPLRKISFSAKISGMFAQVICQQEFENQNNIPIAAVYVFPLPEEAAIVGCDMSIGDRNISAELKEREQARQEYEKAISAGHHASLLEQKRENIFRINVGGIEPGEHIKINTTYNQRVPWQNNGGRLNIPLVVAPRFIPGTPSGTKIGDGWSDDTDVVPDASEITPVVAKDGVPYTADIKVHISPGFASHIRGSGREAAIRRHKLSFYRIGKDFIASS
jgi:Ca-activated chloride channel homolog